MNSSNVALANADSSARFHQSHLWSTLLTLLVGLMATSAATWVNVQHQQNAAQQAFLSEATELGESVRLRLQRTFIFLDTISTLAATYQGEDSPALSSTIQESFPELTNVNVLLPPATSTTPARGITVEAEVIPYSGPVWLLDDPSLLSLLEAVADDGKSRISHLVRRQPSGSGYSGELFWLTRLNNRVIAASIDLASLLSNIEATARFKGLHLQFFDLERYASDPFLRLPNYTELEIATEGMVYNRENRWQAHQTLLMPEREWLLRILPGPGLESRFDSRIALMIFLAGCIISTLLAIIVHLRLQLHSAFERR